MLHDVKYFSLGVLFFSCLNAMEEPRCIKEVYNDTSETISLGILYSKDSAMYRFKLTLQPHAHLQLSGALHHPLTPSVVLEVGIHGGNTFYKEINNLYKETRLKINSRGIEIENMRALEQQHPYTKNIVSPRKQ